MDSQIVYDLLKEIRQEQKEQRIEQKEQNKQLVKLSAIIEKNTDDIKDHIKRTEILESIYQKHEEKIIKLEEPQKFKKWLFNKWSKYLGILVALSALMVGILKICNVINLW